MHIELTEMLRCPQPHDQQHLVLSTGEMVGRMVRSGVLGCPVCQAEYGIFDGVVDFTGSGKREAGSGTPQTGNVKRETGNVDPQTIQALLDLGGPGGIVALVGRAAPHAKRLSDLMGGIHFVGINPPDNCEELSVLSLLRSERVIPLRDSTVRGVLVGADLAREPWLEEAHRVLLRGRRWVVEASSVPVPAGIGVLASDEGLIVGEKR
jgi:uncharacterized protein YbaR (Trm112 family)